MKSSKMGVGTCADAARNHLGKQSDFRLPVALDRTMYPV
jgi:hypothetical protein